MHRLPVFHRQKMYFIDRIIEMNYPALHLKLPQHKQVKFMVRFGAKKVEVSPPFLLNTFSQNCTLSKNYSYLSFQPFLQEVEQIPFTFFIHNITFEEPQHKQVKFMVRFGEKTGLCSVFLFYFNLASLFLKKILKNHPIALQPLFRKFNGKLALKHQLPIYQQHHSISRLSSW